MPTTIRPRVKAPPPPRFFEPGDPIRDSVDMAAFYFASFALTVLLVLVVSGVPMEPASQQTRLALSPRAQFMSP